MGKIPILKFSKFKFFLKFQVDFVEWKNLIA